MRIAIFTPNKNPYSETFIQAHKKFLKGEVFYYYGVGDNLQLEGQSRLVSKSYIRYLNLISKIFKKPHSYLWQYKVAKSLKDKKIDVVLVEYGTHAYILKEVLKQSRIPVITHFHGYDASAYEAVKRCDNYKEVFALSKKVIGVSKVMCYKLSVLGCPKDKLVYNVYGPQPEFVDVKPSFSKSQFIAVGRFTDKKAPYYLVLAFKIVIENFPNAKLLIVGTGNLFESIKNVINYYGLENNIELLGVVTPEKIRQLFSESLAFVQHSITPDNGDMEGTPLAVLEASSAGLPVVSTKHAGIPDVILHEITGLLVDEHDVDGMANNMLRLLKDIDLVKRLGGQGKKRIQENFSLERHISVLDSIINEVVLTR